MERITELPKWFNGTIYDSGDTVTNPFSQETYKLNAIELSMYDFIMGANWFIEKAPNAATNKLVTDLRKGLNWFRKNNPEAYMVLLD